MALTSRDIKTNVTRIPFSSCNFLNPKTHRHKSRICKHHAIRASQLQINTHSKKTTGHHFIGKLDILYLLLISIPCLGLVVATSQSCSWCQQKIMWLRSSLPLHITELNGNCCVAIILIPSLLSAGRSWMGRQVVTEEKDQKKNLSNHLVQHAIPYGGSHRFGPLFTKLTLLQFALLLSPVSDCSPFFCTAELTPIQPAPVFFKNCSDVRLHIPPCA